MEQSQVRGANSERENLVEGDSSWINELFKSQTQKKIKMLYLALIVLTLLGVVLGTFIYSLKQEINIMREQNKSHAYQTSNLNTKIDKIQTNLLNTLANKSEIYDQIKNRILKMTLDIIKLQNHLENSLSQSRITTKKVSLAMTQMEKRLAFSQPKFMKTVMEIKKSSKQTPLFPKILWLYTEFRFQSQKMLEQLLGNFIILKAKESNYEIRFINSWSAYEWLSNKTIQRITHTMQNTKYEQKVDDLLRIAILKEHGGIIMKLDETFYIDDNFDWIGQYLKLDKESKVSSQVFLFSQKSTSEKSEYQDFFIGAVKEAALIEDTFDYMTHIISTGEIQFQNVKKAEYINKDVNSTRIGNMTKNIIQSLIDIMSPQYYGIKTVQTDISMFLTPECRDQLPTLLKKPEWEYKDKCGNPKHIIHITQIDRPKIEEQLEKELINEVLGANQFGYWHNWMVIPSNRKLFDPTPPRKIAYCIIDAYPGKTLSSVKSSMEKLKSQKFKQWTAIYFMKQIDEEMKAYLKKERNSGYSIELVRHSGNVGRNYELGIVRHCPNKTFVVVLRREQRFGDIESLELLSYSIAPRAVLGAFVGVNVTGKVIHSDTYFEWYNKLEHNGKNPQFNVLNSVLNHLRVFHSDCYKIIPQFQLRTPEGQYFQNRFAFLEQFLYMVRNLTDKHDDTEIPHIQKVKWFVKSNQDLFDVPNRIILHRNMVINTDAWEEVDKRELHRNYYKMDSYAMTYNMDHLVQNGIPMSDFAVFNPALQYQPYTLRNKPPLIPKIIHVVWIEGKMPPTKQKIFELNQELYPDFQFKIWSKDNITKTKFPLSYDLLQSIYKMENISRYSKRATMADVLRHQVMYNEGGFYMDTSMILFNNVFYKWLSYKFALATERTFRHRWAQSMCIFGVMPKFPGLLRIISHNNTNRYNIWLRDALEIAGPHNFRWTVRGMQEYDPDYLIMQYDTFYPITLDLPNYFEAYCWIHPSFLSKDDDVVLKLKGRNMIRNCGKYYPYSFGKQINTIGNSWQQPKW